MHNIAKVTTSYLFNAVTMMNSRIVAHMLLKMVRTRQCCFVLMLLSFIYWKQETGERTTFVDLSIKMAEIYETLYETLCTDSQLHLKVTKNKMIIQCQFFHFI